MDDSPAEDIKQTVVVYLYLKGASKRALARMLGLSYYEVNKRLSDAGLGLG